MFLIHYLSSRERQALLLQDSDTELPQRTPICCSRSLASQSQFSDYVEMIPLSFAYPSRSECLGITPSVSTFQVFHMLVHLPSPAIAEESTCPRSIHLRLSSPWEGVTLAPVILSRNAHHLPRFHCRCSQTRDVLPIKLSGCLGLHPCCCLQSERFYLETQLT